MADDKEKTPAEIIEEVSPYYKERKALKEKGVIPNTATAEYKMIYDSAAETLEPVYFWILDFMNNMFSGKVKKLVDNFTASPGSEDFLRTMERGKRMQDYAMSIYGTVNTVIKSVINLIYDLKEFETRLADYERTRAKDPQEAQAGIYTIKQIWMDQVDIKKGRGAINMLAQDLNFVTLRDAFMACNTAADAEKYDLNDRVKRILEARIEEFNKWKDSSEIELKKRYEIEKTYLKTQVDAIKMYSRWAKPYLKAAEESRQAEQDRYKPDIVKAFNTMYLQLTLFGEKKINVADEAMGKNLPPGFQNIKLKRDYYACVLVDFTFRGIPSRVGQNYAFGGKVEVNIKSYAINSEERDLFYDALGNSDFDDAMRLVSGMTTDTLDQLKEDISKYLNEKPKIEVKKEESKDINPFSALFGLNNWSLFKKKEGKAEDDKEKKAKELKTLKEKGVKPDNYAEQVVRALALFTSQGNAFSVYDIYKKSHGMASVPFDQSFAKADVNVSFSDLFKIK